MIDFTKLTIGEIVLAIILGLMVFVVIEMERLEKNKSHRFKQWLNQILKSDNRLEQSKDSK